MWNGLTGDPWMPGIPGTPRSPLSPLGPGSPDGPGSPGLPGSPVGPLCPESPLIPCCKERSIMEEYIYEEFIQRLTKIDDIKRKKGAVEGRIQGRKHFFFFLGHGTISPVLWVQVHQTNPVNANTKTPLFSHSSLPSIIYVSETFIEQ